MSSETPKRLPFGLTPGETLEWIYRILMLLAFMGLLYMRTLFVSTTDFGVTNDRVKKVEDKLLIEEPRIDNVEKSLQAQAANNSVQVSVLSDIKQEIASIRATQRSSDENNGKNFDRIFHKLDTLKSGP